VARAGSGAGRRILAIALVAGAAAGAGQDGGDGSSELAVARRLEGDLQAGRESYEVCASCHLPSGAGRPDGTFPQLAGQHASVLLKQMVDIREGRRSNPIMEPFVRTVSGPQELADLATYIASLPVPEDNGKGDGDELELGRRLFERDCATCHGVNGEGRSETALPRLAGQHYRYLLRQLRDIAAARRHNAAPGMATVVEAYDDAELQAVADWASRLRPPGAGDDAAEAARRTDPTTTRGSD
jgi:cytochrome c553